MMPSYPFYLNYQLPVLPETSPLPVPSITVHSHHSGKTTSRRGSTNIDSLKKFKTEVSPS